MAEPIDFDEAVLERSRQVPVVVDFWAAWCGPCRALGPVLERLAGEARGRWELVPVDVDAQPEIAARYGVRGIPAVKLFRDGQVAGEFVGALPTEQVRAWLERCLPDPTSERLQALVSKWVERGAEIVPDLERFASAHHELAAARAHLAFALVPTDPSRARELLRSLPDDDDLPETKQHIESLLQLMEPRADVPPKLAAHLASAREALVAHDLDRTLGHLVDAAMVDAHYGEDLARRAALALFQRLGQDHELTREHRRKLAMALHA